MLVVLVRVGARAEIVVHNTGQQRVVANSHGLEDEDDKQQQDGQCGRRHRVGHG